MGKRAGATCIRTPKAFTNLQPRVARAGALSWVRGASINPYPERVVEVSRDVRRIRELFQSSIELTKFVSQGAAWGWNFANDIGVD
jgi:hypothetical protein